MNDELLKPTRRRTLTVGIMVWVVALIVAGGPTIALAQAGRAVNQRPPQAPGTPNSLSPYGMPRFGGWYSPYPVKDPTAGERAIVAGRVYRAVTTPRKGESASVGGARDRIELIERFGQWSLRWQEAQDNAATTRAARYQAMADHLRRMSDLEAGRFSSGTGQAAGGSAAPKPPHESAEVARFFRPIDDWDIDRIIPTLLQSERPLNPQGVAVTPTQQVEIAERVYRTILDDAVDRFLASPRGNEPRPDETAVFDALLAERLGFWSDLWRESQDRVSQDPPRRVGALGDRPARVSSSTVRSASPIGPMAALRAHIERMNQLQSGRFVDDALKRAGRSALPPVDMAQFREFVEVVRFLRIEAETRLPGAARPKGANVLDSGQIAMAERIYGAIRDGAAHRYREAARDGNAIADIGLVFDSRLAERLAAWSIRWARAQIRAKPTRDSQFRALGSHVERMASLEDGRAFADALKRADPRATRAAAPTLPRDFTDVARFFRLDALWQVAQARSR